MGGIGSFIGAIHRNAANLDNCIEISFRIFSVSDFNNSLETGKNLYIDPKRIYKSYDENVFQGVKLRFKR